jgi:hypothetical protein
MGQRVAASWRAPGLLLGIARFHQLIDQINQLIDKTDQLVDGLYVALTVLLALHDLSPGLTLPRSKTPNDRVTLSRTA